MLVVFGVNWCQNQLKIIEICKKTKKKQLLSNLTPA